MDEIEERGGHTCFAPDIEICVINFCPSETLTQDSVVKSLKILRVKKTSQFDWPESEWMRVNLDEFNPWEAAVCMIWLRTGSWALGSGEGFTVGTVEMILQSCDTLYPLWDLTASARLHLAKPLWRKRSWSVDINQPSMCDMCISRNTNLWPDGRISTTQDRSDVSWYAI